jgi:hypothetical protein
MAYNTKKGSQHSGDIQYEGDPNDTQIDFENDSIGLKTGGTTRVLVTDTGLSGSAGLQTVGATILGSTLNVSGTINGQTVSATGISGSGTLQTVGATTLGSTLAVSGASTLQAITTTAISASSTLQIVGATTLSSTLFVTGAIVTTQHMSSSLGYQGKSLNIGGESQFKVDAVGVLSGSNTISTVGSISSSANIAVTGAVHAANFYGNGAGITGLTIPVANYNTSGDNRVITSVDSSTIQGEANFTFDGSIGGTGLKVISANISGSNRLNVGTQATIGSTLNVSGATTIGNGNGSSTLTVDNGGWDSGGAYSISGSGRIRGYSMHAGNNQIILGNDEAAVYWPAGEAYILNQGHYSGSKSLVVGGPISGSGTLFMSGAVSGGATLQAAGATTLGSTLSVTGTITAPSLTGSMGLYSLTNGTLQVGHEEVGTGVAVKISTTADNSVPILIKTPSNEILLAATGSGKVLIGGMHLDAKLNISGSDTSKLISAAGTSRGNTFYVSASGETFISGSVILQDVEPTIYFSGSNGAILGQIGYNSANNIVLQNNFNNQHIVLKATDGGVLKEGLRLDGAVPEVVVNQTSDSLVSFRVESDDNTHMFYVSGSTDQVGVGVSDPAIGVTLDISGSAIRLRDPSTPANASAPGVPGEIRWDSNYIYICVAVDTWKRAAIAAW